MHLLGLHGMPRRVYTYSSDMGWGGLSELASIGAALIAVGGLVFIGNYLWRMRNGPLAGNDPWGSDSLEWSTTSPPPNYNYLHLPTVSGRYPLWSRLPDDPVITGLNTDRREVLITGVLDSQPDHRYILPDPSIWPLWTAIAVGIGFVASVFVFHDVTWGIILTTLTLVGWFWPKRDPRHGILKDES